MTLATKSVHDKDSQYNLSSIATIAIILAACLGIGATIAISTFITTTSIPSPQFSEEIASAIPITDVGSVNGFVISPSGLPVSGASLLVYKHMGLTGSTDNSPGYSSSVTTNSNGAYSLNDLPSGLYKFTVTYPNGVVQTINNYAVWPSSSTSYNFGSNSLLTE